MIARFCLSVGCRAYLQRILLCSSVESDVILIASLKGGPLKSPESSHHHCKFSRGGDRDLILNYHHADIDHSQPDQIRNPPQNASRTDPSLDLTFAFLSVDKPSYGRPVAVAWQAPKSIRFIF